MSEPYRKWSEELDLHITGLRKFVVQATPTALNSAQQPMLSTNMQRSVKKNSKQKRRLKESVQKQNCDAEKKEKAQRIGVSRKSCAITFPSPLAAQNLPSELFGMSLALDLAVKCNGLEEEVDDYVER